MAHLVIVGCGVVGAAIAYELSRTTPHTITVLEQHTPAQGATGAALGIAMGVISHKVKGRNWRLREASLRRYATLLPELAELGQPVPHNSQGILSLCFDAENCRAGSRYRKFASARGGNWKFGRPTKSPLPAPT
jgi:glycine oxidase